MTRAPRLLMFTIVTASTTGGTPRLCRHAARCMEARCSFLPDSTIPSFPLYKGRSEVRVHEVVVCHRISEVTQDEIAGIRISDRSERRKLVSAEAADHVSVAKHCPQYLCSPDQQRIASGMTGGVVHGLQTIGVNIKQQ